MEEERKREAKRETFILYSSRTKRFGLTTNQILKREFEGAQSLCRLTFKKVVVIVQFNFIKRKLMIQ